MNAILAQPTADAQVVSCRGLARRRRTTWTFIDNCKLFSFILIRKSTILRFAPRGGVGYDSIHLLINEETNCSPAAYLRFGKRGRAKGERDAAPPPPAFVMQIVAPQSADALHALPASPDVIILKNIHLFAFSAFLAAPTASRFAENKNGGKKRAVKPSQSVGIRNAPITTLDAPTERFNWCLLLFASTPSYLAYLKSLLVVDSRASAGMTAIV
ncbi:unnamed protein product [Leptosia nina]|uniref:Uncharacterized protein n=1 Tax=Leptosia nina TaxID=320188 RepID=A0AAV1JH49_9NEOP